MVLVAIALFAFVFAQLSSPSTASAATGINHQINFQGKLVNPNGTNVTDGSYSIVFSIYTVASAGSNIWTETQSVTVTNGIFQVNLGSVTSLPGSVDFNTDNIYLGIKVGADAEMTPRVQFTSVPQAFNSEKLGGLDKTGFIQNQTAVTQTADFKISGAGTIGTSLTTPLLQAAAATALTITGNAASTWSTSAGNITLQAGSGTVSLGSTTTLSSSGALTIAAGTTLSLSSTTTSAVSLDSGTTGAINIGTSANAKTLTIGNVTGATTVVVNSGSGGIALNGVTTLTASSATALQVTNGTTSALTVDTTVGTTILRGTTTASDAAVIGSELFTGGAAFSAATGWGSISGTNQAATATHTTGTTLISTTGFAPTNGATYLVSFQLAGNTTETNTVIVSLGGTAGQTISQSGTHTHTMVITAGATTALRFTPTTNFNGTISAVSIKLITSANSTLTVQSSNGTGTLQVRVGGAANNNTFIGLDSGKTNTTGTSNTATGSGALQNNTIGVQNTASGTFALFANTTGNYNTASGYSALQNNTTGDSNTAIGYSAGSAVTTGASNVLLGANAGTNLTTGSNNIIIGQGTTASSATVSNSLNIGGLLTGDLVAGTAAFKGQLNVGSGAGVSGSAHLFSDGFETGNELGWTLEGGSGTSAFTYDTSIVRSGKYSAKLVTAGGAGYHEATIPSNATVYARTYFYATSISDPMPLLDLGTASIGSGGHLRVNFNSGGNLGYNQSLNGTSSGVSATAPSLNAWHKIEMKVTVGAATGALQVWLDGVLVPALNLSSQNFGTTNLSNFSVGTADWSSGTIYFDDAVADTVPTGDSSSLYVADGLHVSGNSSFGGAAAFQGQLTVGMAFNTNGKLSIANATNGNTVSLQATATTGYTLDLAPTGATGAQCLQSTSGSTSTATVLQWAGCGGGGGTLQGAYTASTGSTTPEMLLDTTRNGLDIQDANTTIGATQTLLAVRASASATTLGTGLFVVNASGQVGINTGSTSTTPTLSYDLSFGQGANRTIGVETQATAATAGNNLTLQAGTGNTTGAGGTLILQGGSAAATAGSNGGAVVLNGANGSAIGAGGNGGSITLQAGNGQGTGATTGGNVTIQAGSAGGTGVAGSVTVATSGSKTGFQIQGSSSSVIADFSTITAKNLLNEGNFEGGSAATGRWAGLNTPTSIATSADATFMQFGAKSLKVVTGAVANRGAKYAFDFKANMTYTFSVYASVSTGTMSTFDIGANINSSDVTCTVSGTGKTLTTTPTRFSCTFTTGATILNLTDYLYLRNSSATSYTLYFDGAQLEAGPNLTSYTDPAIYNQIGNPSFETGTNGWSATGSGTTIATDETYTYSGTRALKVSTTTTNNAGASFSVPLLASTIYTLSGYARLDTGASVDFVVGRQDNGSNNTCLTNQALSTTYTRFTCTFTTGASVNATTNIFFLKSGATAETIYLDAVQLERNASVSQYIEAFDNLHVDVLSNTVTLNGINSGEIQPWQLNANALPGNRQDASSVVANGYVYEIGGYGGAPTSSVYYAKLNADGSTGAWQTNANALPDTISRGPCVAVNGYVYVLSGFNGSNITTVYYAKLNADGSTGAWQTNANALPITRSYGAAVVANGYVYTVGGLGGGSIYYAKLNADGSTGAWQTNANAPPTSVSQNTAAVANGYIYQIGGFSGSYVSSVYYAKLNADGSTGAWQTNANALPTGLRSATTVVSNGYVYEIGGFNGNYQSIVYYAKLNADGSTGAWQVSNNPLPSTRGAANSVVANGYIYEIGGQNGSGINSTVFYTSTERVLIGGSLDLVGLSGQTLNEQGGTGGTLTAGNTTIVGTLDVRDQATFTTNVGINGALTVNGSAMIKAVQNSTSFAQVQNGSGVNVLNLNTINLIANSDFETGTGAVNQIPDGWAIKGAGTAISLDNTQADFGTNSLKAVTTTTANAGAQYSYQFLPSTQYTLSGYAKVSSSTISDFVVGRQDNGSDVTCLTAQTLTTAWTRFSCTFTTGGTIGISNVFFQKSGASAETFYVDGVQLELGGSVSTFREGDIAINANTTIKNSNNTTTAFQIQNAASSALFTADTINMRISVNASFTAMSVPGSFTTSTATTGGTLAQNSTYRYKVTAIDSVGGETTATAEVSQLTGNTTATNTITLTAWTASPGATGYRIYRTAANGATNTETLYDVVTKPGYTDTGIGAFASGVIPLAGNAYVSTNIAGSTTLSQSIGGLGKPAGQLYVSGTLPTSAVGKVKVATNSWGFYHHGNYVFSIYKSGTSMQIIDVSVPSSPTVVTNFAITGSCETNSVVVVGHYAYVADDCNPKIFVIDITNIKTPVLVNTITTAAGNAQALVSGRYLYSFELSGALQIFDISNPLSVPAALSSTTPASANFAMQASIVGKYVYMITGQTSGNNKLWIYDISNPASPALANAGGTLLSSTSAQGAVLTGHYVYILNTVTSPTFEAWDVKDPSTPVLANSVALDPGVGSNAGSPQYFSMQGRYAYVANQQYNDVNVVDVSNPTSMSLLGAINTGLSPNAVTVSGRYLYVNAYVDNKMEVYDIGGLYSQAIEAGSIVTGNLESTGLATFDSDISVFSSATIGQNLQINDDLGVGGSATFGNASNSTAAFRIQNATGVNLFNVDTSGSKLQIGSATASTNFTQLILNNYANGSTEAASVNGAIYYNTGGKGGASGTSGFEGKFRCYEGSLWKNCIGMRDISERRWGYATIPGSAATQFNVAGSLIMGSVVAAGTSSNQTESNYINYATGAVSGNTNGIGSGTAAASCINTATQCPAATQLSLVTQTRWLPKLATRIRADATGTTMRYWVALTSGSLTASAPPTASVASANNYIGVAVDTAVNTGKFLCVSGNATSNTQTGTDMGITVTAGHYYDVIVDLSTAGTVVCSVSDNGGAYTTIAKSDIVPVTTTSLAIQESVTTSSAAARNLGVAYVYLETN